MLRATALCVPLRGYLRQAALARVGGEARRGARPWLRAGAALGVCAAAAALSVDAAVAAGKEDAQVDAKVDIIGNYENRLRERSSPEKVFEYFASVQRDGVMYMTPEDFFRSITPYMALPRSSVGTSNFKYNWQAKNQQPDAEDFARYVQLLQRLVQGKQVGRDDIDEFITQRSELGMTDALHYEALRSLGVCRVDFDALVERAGGPAHSRFVELVDADGDGLISYAEYLAFSALLAVDERAVRLAFGALGDGSGAVNREAFLEVLRVFMQQTPAGRANRDSSALLPESHVGLVHKLFGNSGTTLTAAAFAEYVRQLQQEVLALEFATFLVSHAGQASRKALMQRVERLRDMHGMVTWREFMAFNDLLRRIRELEAAMDLLSPSGMGLTKQQFARAARAATGDMQVLTPLQVDVLFAVFDNNEDGTVDVGEFVRVLESRHDMGVGQRRDLGVMDFLTSMWRCRQHLRP